MKPSFGLRECLLACTRILQQSGIDSPRLSAEILLAHALELDRNELLKRLVIAPNRPVSEEEKTRAELLTQRRARGEPAAYIVGRKEFYGRDFCVSPDTLVPRPETELLVDLALEEARSYPADHRGLFADFGTGTGCIAVTLALALPGWRGLALDLCGKALSTAAANSRRYSLSNLGLAQADFTAPPLKPGSLELLLSNPPYVSEAEYACLDREVRDFEPKSALVPTVPQTDQCPALSFSEASNETGGCAAKRPKPACRFTARATGLEHSLSILKAAAWLLKPGGSLFLEIGCSQAGALLAALQCGNWRKSSVHRDLAGKDRVLAVRK
jgi:release factor glutamine methyltransferase